MYQTVYFELLNEPHNGLGSALWNEMAAETLALIRKSNPTRAVIIGPANWNGADALPTLNVPDDPYVIVTFHDHLPFQFTHQGAEWVDNSDPWLGTIWPANDAEQLRINMDFDRAARPGPRNRGFRSFWANLGRMAKALLYME